MHPGDATVAAGESCWRSPPPRRPRQRIRRGAPALGGWPRSTAGDGWRRRPLPGGDPGSRPRFHLPGARWRCREPRLPRSRGPAAAHRCGAPAHHPARLYRAASQRAGGGDATVIAASTIDIDADIIGDDLVAASLEGEGASQAMAIAPAAATRPRRVSASVVARADRTWWLKLTGSGAYQARLPQRWLIYRARGRAADGVAVRVCAGTAAGAAGRSRAADGGGRRRPRPAPRSSRITVSAASRTTPTRPRHPAHGPLRRAAAGGACRCRRIGDRRHPRRRGRSGRLRRPVIARGAPRADRGLARCCRGGGAGAHALGAGPGAGCDLAQPRHRGARVGDPRARGGGRRSRAPPRRTGADRRPCACQRARQHRGGAGARVDHRGRLCRARAPPRPRARGLERRRGRAAGARG